MDKKTAHKLIKTLGASVKKIMAERGHEIEPMGDLFAGIGAFHNMMLTDDDIPGITEAHDIVIADCTAAGWEMMKGEFA